MRKWNDYFLQAILVFFSVFLGILAGNWNSNRLEKAKSKKFLENLVVEYEKNRKQLELKLDYHQLLKNASDSIFSKMDAELAQLTLMDMGGFSQSPHWRGTGIGSLEQAVYNSGMHSNAFDHIPIEYLSQISRVHSYENEYHRFTESISDKLINLEGRSLYTDFLIIQSILGSDVLSIEKNLIKSYEVMEERLKDCSI